VETLNATPDQTTIPIFCGMVGQSAGIRKIAELVQRIADTDVNILITGETGTGKELVARALHACSRRREKPFVTINCSALPDSLLESELFGYEKGAFTGAVTRKKGKFEMAQGGSLFLDEIGDMSMPAQAKLLRVTEEETIEHLGGTKKISVNRRLLAATSRNIEDQIMNDLFRKDLFHRLNEVNIHLPPLRERKEDIPYLTRFFVQVFCEKMGIEPKRIADSSLALLTRYEWPGNIRELRNIMKKAVLLTEGDTVWIEQLPLQFNVNSVAGKEWGIYQKKLVTLEELERDYVLHVLKATNNNKKRAAEILGIDRTSLYYKLRRFNLGPQSQAALED